MEKINPVFTENCIPICFSANDKYIPLLSVEIASIIANSKQENNYDLVILTTGISDENHFRLLAQIKNYPNFSIRVVNVSQMVYGYDFYLESDITNTKYSSEVYFRILVPALMPNYKNVIFCDADIVFLNDVAELANLDLGNNYLGAVRDYEGIAYCYNNNFDRTRYRINDLAIKNFENYFASGVLVFNIQKFNENFSQNDLLNLSVSKQWKQYDQDLFNFLCKDNVLIIDAKYNFIEDIDNTYPSLPQNLFKEYLDSEKDPKLVHYAGRRKPWININSKYNKHFWQYAEKTPFISTLKNLLEK